MTSVGSESQGLVGASNIRTLFILKHDNLLTLTPHLLLLQLQPFEIPKFVHLRDEPFSMHNELLTATFKNCRPKLRERFQATLSKLYDALEVVEIQNRLQQILVSVTGGASSDTNAWNGSFVENGGDSLTAVKLVEMLRAQFSVRVP